MVPIGKFLQVDPFMERNRLISTDALNDVLQPQPRRGGEHGQHSSIEHVLASPPEPVVPSGTFQTRRQDPATAILGGKIAPLLRLVS